MHYRGSIQIDCIIVIKLTGNAKKELKKSTNPSSSSNNVSWKDKEKLGRLSEKMTFQSIKGIMLSTDSEEETCLTNGRKV